jgi:hypothetical protein
LARKSAGHNCESLSAAKIWLTRAREQNIDKMILIIELSKLNIPE